MRSLICLAAALLFIACGGSGSSAKSSSSHAAMITGTIDACTLITASDATNAVGMTMTSLGSAPGQPVCSYQSQGPAGNTTLLFVYAQAYADTANADAVSPDQMAAAFRSQFGITSAKSVSGIGDKAVEYTTSSTDFNSGVVIFVFKSNVVLLIALMPTTNPAKVEALARIAVGNLPKS